MPLGNSDFLYDLIYTKMAYAIITNHFAQGFANKASGTKFTWWKTSFNMPVRNIFDNSSIYDEYE
jgi:hypothetical protein